MALATIGLMLSSHEQKNVWEEWLSSEIRALYFADLSYRYRRAQRIATWLTLATSSGAFVSLIADGLPPGAAWLHPTLVFLTAALSLWHVVAHYEQSGMECADLHFRWTTLATQYEALWDRMSAPDAETVLHTLMQKTADLSKSSTAFPNREDLMVKWQDHVVKHHEADMAA